MEVLHDFCDLSGQSITLMNPELLVSPNVPRRKAKRISDFYGIALTTNLGKYLGGPLLHKRVTSKQDF